MQTIEFTVEELETLREVLRHKLTEADVEMFRTDTHDFKQLLKHHRDTLEHVLRKLDHAPVPS